MTFSAQQIRRSIIALSLAVLSSLVVDQATKIKAENNLMVWSHDTDLRQYQGKRYPLGSLGNPESSYIGLNMNYVRNQGAAWGMLSSVEDSIRIPFFYIVTLIAIFFISNYLRQTPPHHRIARYGLSMILSGALGNCLDRIRLGYVIDFIDVRWRFDLFSSSWAYNFPNFNIADSCITLGVGCMLVDMLLLEPKRESEQGVVNATKVSSKLNS
ncbi:MAG: signal peptidase II [Oligoflexales bacterium]